MKKNIASLLIASTFLASCSYMPSWMGGSEDEKPKLAGERKVALAVEGKLSPDAEIKNTIPKLPAVNTNSEWNKNTGISGNLAGSGFSSESSAEAGDGNRFSHSLVPNPVVASGMVFVMDSAGVVSAHDAANISNIRWTSKTVADEDDNEVIGGGLAVDSGILYASTGQGKIAAFNVADGNQIWIKNFSTPLRGSPRIVAGKVIISSINSQTYALSSKTGDILWDHRGINETAAVMNSVSPTVVGEDILLPYSSGELFFISAADGRELWGDTVSGNMHTQASGIFTGIGGDPVVDGVVAFITSNNEVTTAINMQNGKRIWQQQAGSINTPWLSGDDLYLLTSDNTLVDFIKYTGKVRWLAQLDSFEDMESKRRPISWRGPVMVGGKLVVVSSNGQLVFVSAESGKIVETKSIPDNIVTAPVVASGKLYLVSQDATLYSFQ